MCEYKSLQYLFRCVPPVSITYASSRWDFRCIWWLLLFLVADTQLYKRLCPCGKTRTFDTFCICLSVGGGFGCGWGLDAPAHPSATILWPRVTCCCSIGFPRRVLTPLTRLRWCMMVNVFRSAVVRSHSLCAISNICYCRIIVSPLRKHLDLNWLKSHIFLFIRTLFTRITASDLAKW